MTPNQTPLIQTKNLAVGYERTPLLSNLNLDIGSEEFIAIVGPNGSGKTALVKTLLGLLPSLDGEIIRANDGKTPIKMGYVPQHARLNLIIPLSVSEFLDLKGNVDENEKAEILKNLSINNSAILEAPLSQLSVGQRQRVLVAFALLGRPKLVFLDEATDGLDFRSQKEFFQLMKGLQKNSGVSIVFISHDITAVGAYASRVICLNQSLLFDGQPNSPEFHSCLHGIYGKDSFIHDHHGHNHSEN